MTDITIPPEAVKGLRAALTACDCDDCVTDMIRAMLKAWPGMVQRRSWDGSLGRIILPLPQEETTHD